MDNDFKLIIKWGDRGIAKCSVDFTRGDLVNYVAAKWAGMSKEHVSISYDLRGSGELELMDDEDMATMFQLMEEMQTRWVNIYFKSVGGSTVRNEGGNFNVGAQLVKWSDSGTNSSNQEQFR